MLDLTKNHVIHGDATKVLVEQIKDNSIDMVFTVPSGVFYYTTDINEGQKNYGKVGSQSTVDKYIIDLVEILKTLHPKLKDTGSLFVNIGDYYDAKTRCLQGIPSKFIDAMEKQTQWNYKSELIWDRSGERDSYQVDTKRYKRDHEFIFHFTKLPMKHQFNDHDYLYYKESILSYPLREPKKDEFSSGYPHEVIEHCMLPTTEKGNVVMDIFAQTGSVAEVALKHERNFIMIEIDKKWYSKLKEKLIHHL